MFRCPGYSHAQEPAGKQRLRSSPSNRPGRHPQGSAGQGNVGDYLALGSQFKNTPGFVLLETFAEHLHFINDNLVNTADRPDFQSWLRQTFSPMMQQLGYAARPSDSPTDRQKRAILFSMLGTLGEDPEVIQQARTLVQEYMKDPRSIDGTLAKSVIKVAALHGDAELYNQFKAHLKNTKSPEEYYRYFYALGEFPQQNLIQQTLASTLTPDVRGQDLYLLPQMMQYPAARDVTWNFMQQNYHAISNKTGGGLGGFGIFLYSAQGFCSEEKAQEVQQFFQQHPIQGTERNQKEALEAINSCVTLRSQQQSTLAAWLKQNASTNASTSGTTSGSASVR